MGKTIPISKYTQLSDSELMAEAQRLRYEIDHPALSAGDHLSNLFLSVIGAGTTVSTAVGGGFAFMRESQKDFSVKNIKEFGSLFLNRFSSKDKAKAYQSYVNKEENKNFANTLLATVSSFALTSLVMIPIIHNYQKKERSEDNATKLGHAERILTERGYETEVKTLTR